MAKKKKAKKQKRTKKLVTTAVADAPKKTEAEPTIWILTCDYCKEKKPYSFMESDPEWEVDGHPDRIHRAVCVDCAPEVNARWDCANAIFEAMRKQLRAKGMESYEIENAVHIAWRAFLVQVDVKAMVKLGRQLKVKHPYLKGKRSK